MPKRKNSLLLTIACAVCAFSLNAHAQAILPNDVLLGLGAQDTPDLSIELVRGPADTPFPEQEPGIWSTPFVQSLELDNLNSISHNPQGNLVAATFGTEAGGGTIHNLPTHEDGTGNSQLIGDMLGIGGGGITLTRLGGLSVSPDNSKIAVAGYDSGRVVVYDYTAGDTLGGGASLANARESDVILYDGEDTQGTRWLDNNNVMGFSADGEISVVDATTMNSQVAVKIDGKSGGSAFTSIEYNPVVAPYVYASYSEFDGGTLNTVYVFDPNDDFKLVKELDYSGVDLETGDPLVQTLREIGLSAEGHLFMSQFSGDISVILDADDPENLVDDGALFWYEAVSFASFSGIDVAVGLEISSSVVGDYNMNGLLDSGDLDLQADQIQSDTPDLATYDLNNDEVVDVKDREVWTEDLFGSYLGDWNLDGEFESADLVAVFGKGNYEKPDRTALWPDGDSDGNGRFGSADLVAAFSAGGYEEGPRPAASAVPEPSSLVLLAIGILAWIAQRRSEQLL